MSNLVIPRISRECVLWQQGLQGMEGGVPCWEPVANYSSPAGPHSTPTPSRQPPKGRGGVGLFESDHSHPLTIESVATSSSGPYLSVISQPASHSISCSPPTTFHHLIFNLRTPSYSSRAPQPCYDDASLPTAAHHLQLKCFVSLVSKSKCIDLPMAADAEATSLQLLLHPSIPPLAFHWRPCIDQDRPRVLTVAVLI